MHYRNIFCVVGLRKFTDLNKSSILLGLFSVHHVPNPTFWNKLTPPIEDAEFIDAFHDYLTNDNIDLSHNADPSSPNRSIRDYCMFSGIKLMNAKYYLKLDAFQTKFCTSQHQLGKMLSN